MTFTARRRFVAALCLTSLVYAQADLEAATQISDFRLAPSTYPSNLPEIDRTVETWSHLTRTPQSVIDDPTLPNVPTVFSGLGQNANGVLSTLTNGRDVQITSFGGETVLRTLSRYLVPIREPGQAGGRSGAMQFHVDLSSLDEYLATNNLTLTSLDLNFLLGTSDQFMPYDILLSYTNPSEGITQDGISTLVTDDWDNGGAFLNYWKHFWPLHYEQAGPFAADFNNDNAVDGLDLSVWKEGFGGPGDRTQGDANEDGFIDGADFLAWQRQVGVVAGSPQEGDIFGGSFLVLEKNVTGDEYYPTDITVEKDLLSLFNSGVREFNVIVQSAAFGDLRAVIIRNGAGVYMETAPAGGVSAVPEPTACLLAVLATGFAGAYRRRSRRDGGVRSDC